LIELAPHLTSSQVENIMKSDKVDPATKASLMKSRQVAIKNMIDTGSGVLSKKLTELSIDQIETMGDEWIRDNVHLFSNDQVNGLKQSKKFTESQKNSYTAQRTDWHKAAITGATFNGKVTDKSNLVNHTGPGTPGRRKPVDIANLGRAILVDSMTPAFLIANPTFLNKDVLEVISETKTLGATDRARLQESIETAYAMSSGATSTALEPLINYFTTPRVLNNGF